MVDARPGADSSAVSCRSQADELEKEKGSKKTPRKAFSRRCTARKKKGALKRPHSGKSEGTQTDQQNSKKWELQTACNAREKRQAKQKERKS